MSEVIHRIETTFELWFSGTNPSHVAVTHLDCGDAFSALRVLAASQGGWMRAIGNEWANLAQANKVSVYASRVLEAVDPNE